MSQTNKNDVNYIYLCVMKGSVGYLTEKQISRTGWVFKWLILDGLRVWIKNERKASSSQVRGEWSATNCDIQMTAGGHFGICWKRRIVIKWIMCGWIALAFEKHCCEIGTLLQGNYKKIIIATKPCSWFQMARGSISTRIRHTHATWPKKTHNELTMNNNLPIYCQWTGQKVLILIRNKYGREHSSIF